MMTEYKVIVNKSTVPVGTADRVRETISSKTDIPFDVVSNPEFLREGFAVEDSMNPSRVVVGQAQKKLKILCLKYISLLPIPEFPSFLWMRSLRNLPNMQRIHFSSKITFMNEIANYCEKVGADVDKVRLGMGSDDRIGTDFYSSNRIWRKLLPKDVKSTYKNPETGRF